MIDGTLVGKIEDVLRALNIIIDLGAERGFLINPSKCELWWHRLHPALHRDVWQLGQDRPQTLQIALIERIVHRSESGRPRSQETCYFYQRLSVALQRCNSNAFIRRAPAPLPAFDAV